MMQLTPTVKQLLIINVIFFIGSQVVPQSYDFLSLFYFENDKFMFWQPLTSMFMHAPMPNIMHIAFNMFALYSFGSILEHFWGWQRFLFFYISCGIGAAAVQMGINYLEIQNIMQDATALNLSSEQIHHIFNFNFEQGGYLRGDLFESQLKPYLTAIGKIGALDQQGFDALYTAAATSKSTMVGASGAIYGLLVAFAFTFPEMKMMMIFAPFPIKAKYFVPGMLVLDLVGGVSSSAIVGGPSTGIAHFAHLGGALLGFVMMLLWRNKKFKANRWD